jgi:signal transduction histidine kinase
MSEPFFRKGGLPGWARQNLQRQFAFIAAALILLSSAILLFFVVSEYRSSIFRAHEAASLNVNLLLQSSLENAMIKRDLDGLQDIVARLGAQEGVAGVMIANPAGEIRFSSYTGLIGASVDDNQFDLARTTFEAQTGVRELADGREVLRSINPVQNQPQCGTCHGTISDSPINGLLIVDYDSSEVSQLAWRGAIMLAALGIFVLILLEAGLWMALRRIVLDRLNHLVVTTKQIASGKLSVRTETSGQDEIAELGRSFDIMASQLEHKVEELRASRNVLQVLIDAIPDGIRVIGPDYRIILANQAYRDQVGMETEDLIGQYCYASSHRRSTPCVPTLVLCPVAEMLEGDKRELTCSHVHKDADGADISVEVSAARVTMVLDGEETNCVVEAIRDLEANMTISHNQRLAEMGMLAAGVAHEVYNPLASISLALRSIKGQDELTAQSRSYIDVAEAEIENCRSITDSLLRLATPPNHAAGLIDLTHLIDDTMSLLRLEAEQHNVSVTKEIVGRPRVVAKDSDIRILIFNLVLNAIHAMPSGGDLRIALRTQDDEVLLEVEDSGVGITDRDKSKILLPFWSRRADGTQGRGLGLAICAAIIKELGGQITFDSSPNKGTRFRIVLPNGGEFRE